MKKSIVILLLLVATAMGGAQTHASLLGTVPKEVHWRLSNTLGLGTNQLVGGLITRPYLYIPFGHSEGLLFGQTNFKIGPINTFCPNFDKFGAQISFSPIIVLDLDLIYYSIFDWSARFFESLDDKYDKHRRDKMGMEFMRGDQYIATATVKAKAGPVILLSMNDLEYWSVKDYYFSIELNTILKSGWDWRHKVFLAYEARSDLLVFANYEFFKIDVSQHESSLLSCGLIVDGLVPESTVILQTGYHLNNPDFSGWKFLIGVLTDFPLSKRKKASSPEP